MAFTEPCLGFHIFPFTPLSLPPPSLPPFFLPSFPPILTTLKKKGFIYLFERVRAHKWGEEQRGRGREFQADPPLSVDPNGGLDPMMLRL